MKCFHLLFSLLVLLQVATTLRPIHAHSSQVNNTNRIRCLEKERQALLDIKGELVDVHGRLCSWGNEENKRDCCKWEGVHCHNRSNHVTQLNLAFYQLQGKISTSLLELEHLRYLDLSENDFEYAPIPEFIGSFTKLRYLRLSNSNFSGPIPRQIGNMISLEYLNLSKNGLEGGIPKHFGNLSSLVNLYMKENNLTGDLHELISRLSGPTEKKLEKLDLSMNTITGFFPNMSRFSSLLTLDLHENKLSGPLGEDNLRLPNLTYLDLSFNLITGPVPDLSICSSLEYLCMSNNRLNGTLTQSIGGLSQLLELDFSKNEFLEVQFSHRWAPDFLLEYLDLRVCKLGSNFPTWLKTQTELQYIDISGTGISDTIPVSQVDFPVPTSMSNCTSLEMIDVGDNRLTGKIPDWIGNSFSENLSGSIPNSLCDLSHLGVLDLSYNNLSGRIPQNNQGLTFKESAFEGNIGLCGLPLNKSCPGDKSHQGPNSRVGRTKVGEEFEDDRFITDGFYISMGLGFIVGFWGIFGTILLNKTFRYAFFGRWDRCLVRIELSKARLWSCFENR
ncbi:UNVERIFIED_CONTAM: Receptor-like protein EIX1 [Sesamum radiatum]|uniref:Receptor-like protein EIX1 n=1 Tax=Sesamum radiatum TaxID=300843 RepID=A0AAW2JYS7_SESRA